MNEDQVEGIMEEMSNIQDIIRTRKADRRQKAEKQRQMALQRIRDMKSTEGIDPLEQFPKEIWAMIFSEVDPEDRGNAWQLHPVFRNILNANRLGDILFPQVSKIGTFKFHVKYRDGDKMNCDFKYEQLRGVSKTIMKSYDRWVESKVEKRIKEGEACSYPYIPGVETLRLFSSCERKDLKVGLAKYKKDQENPAKHFFRRAILVSFTEYGMDLDDGEVEDDIPQIISDFRSNLTSFLEIIGNQIWNFRFRFGSFQPGIFSSSELYILFQTLISLMPNLKYLEMEIEVGRQIIQMEEELLVNHPFPRLDSLERVSFHSPFEPVGDRKGFSIYGAVLKANQHVKMLDLAEADDWNFQSIPNGLIKSLPLTSLRSCGKDLIGTTTLEKIQHIVNFNWPLKTINMSLDYDYCETETNSRPPIMRLFQFLERFQTLETVKLKVLKGIRFGEESDYEFGYLNLPKLKDLEFTFTEPEIFYEGNRNIHFFFSLQFLLHCKELKTLKWRMRLYEDSELRQHLKEIEDGNMVDFRAGLRVLYESNIWDVFPSLSVVKVEIIKLPMKECCRNYPFSCEHEYRRRTALDGKLSLGEFLRSHRCSRKNGLQNCVILQG